MTYFSDKLLSAFKDLGETNRPLSIEPGALADDAVVTGAILKQWINQHAEALEPLVPILPRRAALAFLIELGLPGSVGGVQPDAGSVPPGYAFMDTADGDLIEISDGASWIPVSGDNATKFLELVQIPLYNRLASKVGTTELAALSATLSGAAPTGTTLKSLLDQIVVERARIDAKQDAASPAANALQLGGFGPAHFLALANATGLLDASKVSGILDPSTIPPSIRAAPQVSSGGVADLTSGQQEGIGQGSPVLLSDGRVLYYKGTGSKISEASYVVGADQTPAAEQIPTLPISKTSGLQDALDAKVAAAGGDASALVATARSGAIARPLIARFSGRFDPMDYGAVPDGSTSGQQTPIIAAINAAIAAGGGTVVFGSSQGGHDFLISGSVVPNAITAPLVFEFLGGARLKAAAGLAVPVMRLWHSSSDLDAWTEYNLAILNPSVDCSLGNSAAGEATCSGISLQYGRNVLIENPYLYGGTDPSNTNADSGIGTVGCKKVLIRGGMIEGFGDAGVYPNGDNTVGAGDDDGLVCILDNVDIRRCNSAVTPKRELRHLKVLGGTFEECNAGILATTVNSPFVGPVRRMDILGTTFRKMPANMLRFTGGTKGSYRDCLFEDWGYNPVTGTGSVGVNARAVDMNGASGIDASGNVYQLKDWTRAAQSAIAFRNATLDSVPFTHGKCRFNGETFRGISAPWVIDAAGDPHLFENIIFDDVTTKVPTTNLNAATRISYREVGALQQYEQVGANKPMALSPDWGAGYTRITLADDEMLTLPIPGGDNEAEFRLMTAGSTAPAPKGRFHVRGTASPISATIQILSATNFVHSTTIDTVAAATDGSITLSALNGNIYLINRSGGPRRFSWEWIPV
jgi:hypothetical protein